jgi:hypothetical protein
LIKIDLSLPTFSPVGLFWTLEISEDDSGKPEGDSQETGESSSGGVKVELGRGSATMRVSNAPILDYGAIPNALFGGGPPAVPGSVSFRSSGAGGPKGEH